MPKQTPPCPAAPQSRAPARSTLEYRIELITPLFGGGVEAGEPDPSFPVRTTAIRGQLQFWWRATRGASCLTRDELFTRHGRVWGTTERASPVEIDSRDIRFDRPRPCGAYTPRHDGKLQLRWNPPFGGAELPYALFPFQGKLADDRRHVEKAPASFVASGSFVVRVRFPEALRQDVETSVWAWVNFGGLGARTRRGCGAIRCTEIAPKDVASLQTWLRAGTAAISSGVRDWPTIPSAILVRPQPGEPVGVWDWLTGRWRHFRQGEGFARNRGMQPNRPGRSRYPEPETIRRVTGRRSGAHRRLGHIPDSAFPRAELGLPIVFHFKDHGEPPDTVVYPADAPDGHRRERMASSIILKPLALADGQAIPLIMNLVTPRLAGIDLRQGEHSLPLPPATVIRDGALAVYRDSPLAGAPTGSARDAFVAFARDPANGFQEVIR